MVKSLNFRGSLSHLSRKQRKFVTALGSHKTLLKTINRLDVRRIQLSLSLFSIRTGVLFPFRFPAAQRDHGAHITSGSYARLNGVSIFNRRNGT